MATIHTFTGNEVIATEVPKYLNDNFSALNSVDEDIKTQLGAKAPLASPTLTGTPKAPTASQGTNTTQIATTAFVASAVKVKSVNGKTGDVVVDTLPVGTSIMYMGNTVPDGYLAENGAAISRTTYAKLFAVIGTKYGAGNGSTTFNLPNKNNGSFAEGSNTAGTVKSAGLPNIWGVGKPVMHGSNGVWDGAFSTMTDGGGVSGISGGTENCFSWLIFDASKSNTIYGNSKTVQPKSVTVKFCIKY